MSLQGVSIVIHQISVDFFVKSKRDKVKADTQENNKKAKSNTETFNHLECELGSRHIFPLSCKIKGQLLNISI